MTTAMLCDGEPLMRATLRDHLQCLWPELDIVGEAECGPAALREIAKLKPDIAFPDIQMPGLTGAQVAQLVDPATPVVFVTAFDRYALPAFDAHAVDYLLQSMNVVRQAKLVGRLRQRPAAAGAPAGIQALMQKLAARAEPASMPALEWLQVDAGKQIRRLHLGDAMHFESDEKDARVQGEDCDGLIRLSLKELLGAVHARAFVRVHRSVVVNRRFVHSAHRRSEPMDLQTRGRPERLRVSESNQPLFKSM